MSNHIAISVLKWQLMVYGRRVIEDNQPVSSIRRIGDTCYCNKESENKMEKKEKK